MGGADFDKIGGEGGYPRQIFTFDTFVNDIVEILVNFLDFVNFVTSFFSRNLLVILMMNVLFACPIIVHGQLIIGV